MKKKKQLSKLDLSYGSVQPDFTRLKHDLTKFPWAVDSESAEEVFSNNMFSRIPAKQRGKFMDEIHRILVPNGKATIVCPYWSSASGIQDFMQEWPPVVEQSFLYFNKKWREENGAADYPIKCDFDFTYGYSVDQE